MDARLLFEYRWMKQEAADLKDRINSIYESALFPGIKKISDMPMAPGYSTEGLSRLFEQLEELTELYTAKHKQLTEWCIEIEEGIAELSSLERQIIRLRYLDCKSWKEIGVSINYSIAQAKRIHKKVLQKLKDDTL